MFGRPRMLYAGVVPFYCGVSGLGEYVGTALPQASMASVATRSQC